ncbi:hypothetical protein GCM10020000_49210 [Streptomyces olivoverticillatus]
MTFFASERGLVRKPKPHDMCMVASATGIRTRAAGDSPLPAGTEPAVIAARYPAGTTRPHGVTVAPTTIPAAMASTAVGGAR